MKKGCVKKAAVQRQWPGEPLPRVFAKCPEHSRGKRVSGSAKETGFNLSTDIDSSVFKWVGRHCISGVKRHALQL